MHLTPSQQEAFDTLYSFASGATKHGIATLSGYAGVGKTTVVIELIKRLCAGAPPRVLVTAPTHKALAVLAAKLGQTDSELMTTQAALGLKLIEMDSGDQRLQKDSKPKIEQYELVVVDEASMLHPDIFATILASRMRSRVLFVGDPAQLAPVGSDEPSLAFSDIVPLHVSLTEVVRQAKEHPAIRMSVTLREDVQEGRTPTLARLAGLMQPGDERHMAITCGGDTALQMHTIDALKRGFDTRILAFTNRACLRHNDAIHNALYPGVQGFAVGEQVIAQDGFTMRRNGFESAHVRTSQLLTVQSVTEAGHPDSPDVPAWLIRLEQDGTQGEAWVAQDRKMLETRINDLFAEWRRCKSAADSEKNFSAREQAKDDAKKASSEAWALRGRFANIRHAYALTIHKAQGSTFETVLIDWSSLPADGGADAARLAYVAITRPSRHAVIVTQ